MDKNVHYNVTYNTKNCSQSRCFDELWFNSTIQLETDIRLLQNIRCQGEMFIIYVKWEKQYG